MAREGDTELPAPPYRPALASPWCSNTVNFQEWSVINVPGQGSLDLNTFLCKQPVSVVVYDFTAANASAAHKARCVCAGCSCVRRWVCTPLV